MEINISHQSFNLETIAIVLDKDQSWQQLVYTVNQLKRLAYMEIMYPLVELILNGLFFSNRLRNLQRLLVVRLTLLQM